MTEFTRFEIYVLLNQNKPLWLAGSDLTGADLRWANLSGADLTGANLSKASGLTENQIKFVKSL